LRRIFSLAPHEARERMMGLAAAAAAAPGCDWIVSAEEVPGSTTWTLAALGTEASVLRERTWYLEAPVTMYGLVPTSPLAALALAASAGSGPSACSPFSDCHRLQVEPVCVRIWYWSPALTAPLGQVTPTTVTSPATFCAGATAPERAVEIGSLAVGVLGCELDASLADLIEATEDFTKPTSRSWLLTGWAWAC
jgi:hypothetical protein